MGNQTSLPTEHLRIGRIQSGTLLIELYTPESMATLQALAQTYKGILAVNMSQYTSSRKEPPLFESIDTLVSFATKDTILCFIPGIDDVIEHLYKSYTIEGKSINVYRCNYALYGLVDKAFAAHTVALLGDLEI